MSLPRDLVLGRIMDQQLDDDHNYVLVVRQDPRRREQEEEGAARPTPAATAAGNHAGPAPPPARSSSNVSVAAAEEWGKEVLADPKNRLALAALTSHAPPQVLTSRAALRGTPHAFNVTLPADGAPVTNQRASGRCWLFAATNIFRLALMRRHNLREFELSQAYLFFWDKLEKANFFLEQALDTAAEPLDGQLLRALMASPVGDGGQWDMVANLVDKYGLVPQALYPDAFSAANSGGMDQLLTTRLRVDALALRALAQRATTAASELAAAKDAMLRDIFRILALTLGPPPFPSETFTWEYHDRDNHFHSVHTTPLDFAAELDSAATLRANRGVRVRRLFSLVHDPRHAPLRLLTVARLGNVVEGRPVTYVNVGLPTLKRACVAQLRAGLPVFFGSDVGKYLDREHGVMDLGVVDYEVAFGVEVGSMAMDKTQRLGVGESAMTHAMVLTGVHVEPASEADVRSGRAEKGGERTVRWRVENSWGASTGDKGYYVMADGWMDQFVYQAVVDPRFVEQEVQDVLKQEPLVLPLWDPMGALA